MTNRVEVARQVQPQWAKLSVRERLAAIKKIRLALAAKIDRVVGTICDEVGKPPLDALSGDVLVVLEHLRYCEKQAAKVLQARRVDKPSILFRGARFDEVTEPHGVALVFAPWNYPLQLAMVPMVTALVAGNAVILKCSERTLKVAAMIAELCTEAKLPTGLVQVCCDAPNEARALIEARPDVVFFTGSSGNGRAVAERCATLQIPTIMELGGKDACLVFASCDVKRALDGVTYGAFSNAGQVCVGAKRVYVERGIFAEFVACLIARAREVRVGTGMDCDMGPVRIEFARTLLAEQVDDAVAQAATLHTEWDRRGDVVPPLILTEVSHASRLLNEETFGPVVCLEAFDNEAEAIALANDSTFALGASVFSGDDAQAQRVARALSVGSCTINDVIRSVGNPYAAFGGNKASGYGRYHGRAGLEAFSRVKTVMTVTRPQRVEVHWFPFTAKTYTRLRGLMLFRHGAGGAVARMKQLMRIR
jgi:acyl-CoA reductase-like NAD-dependent aldehyde dehydrogenase